MDARVSPQAMRVTVVDTDDSGPQQFVHATGLQGQDIGRMVRVQHFGESSNPPAGSEGHALALGGGADRFFVLGLEHPQYRPKSLPVGGKAIYDSAGNIISLVLTKIKIVSPTEIDLIVGGCKLAITSDGFAFTGGMVTHQTLDIGATHVHGGVSPGAANTGVPNP